MFNTKKFILLIGLSSSLLAPLSFAKTEAECAGLKPPELTREQQLHCQQSGAACVTLSLKYMQCLAEVSQPKPLPICGANTGPQCTPSRALPGGRPFYWPR